MTAILLAALGFFPVRVVSAEVSVSTGPAALVERAVTELKARDFEAAVKDATRAMDQGYRKTSAFNTRSAAYTGLGKYKEGLADAEMSVKYNPGGAAGYLSRAAAKEGLNAPQDEILADYKKAAELDKRWTALYEEAQAKYSSAGKASAAGAPSPAPRESVPARAPEPVEKPAERPAGPWKKILAGMVVAAAVVLAGWYWRRFRHQGPTRRVRFAAVPTAAGPGGGDAREGSVIGGRYILGRSLAREGAVELYDGRDLEDQPKLIARLPMRVELLARAKAAQALRHPAIVAVEETFDSGGWLYLVRDDAPGETVRQSLDRKTAGRMTPAAVLRVLQSAAAAVDHAHARGVVHGHLSPAQLIADPAGVRVKGFGMPAEPVDAPYLAPEQEAGPATPASDVYSLGACLFEMLTGRRPFAGPDAVQAKRERRLAAASSLAPGLPAGVDDLLLRALEPEPERRFRAAAELFGAFRALVVPGVQ